MVALWNYDSRQFMTAFKFPHVNTLTEPNGKFVTDTKFIVIQEHFDVHV